jgi:DNA repair protein RecO (recombination protein O)
MLDHDIWPAAYIAWEIALLRELGFSLDLSKCASGSGTSDLAYVSPKTGRAVSAAAGEPYKDKLLILPQFLTPQSGEADERDICNGFALSEYFLEHWAFTHHTQGLPEPRLRLAQRMRAALLKDENARAHTGGAGQ